MILAPVILFLIGLLIAAGRTSIAQGSVNAAARDAARQASISRTPAAAQAAALASARAALGQDALDCAPVVTVNTSGFGIPVGQPAQVSGQVTCRVPLSDLLVPGMPGGRTLTATLYLAARSLPGQVTRDEHRGTCHRNRHRPGGTIERRTAHDEP